MKLERDIECTACGAQFHATFADQSEADAFERAGALCDDCEFLLFGEVDDDESI